MYVGYGHHVARALSHSGGSHNPQLEEWLGKNNFDLRVAGPYGSEDEAKKVEAALISALNPELNHAPGDGPQFVPVGVPPGLWERPQMDPLTLREIGIATGGALLVYLAPGDQLRDGRKKFDAALPTDQDAVSNIEMSWDIDRHLDEWRSSPSAAPKVVLGVHGPVKHRFVVGSLAIKTEELGNPEFKREAKQWNGHHRWRIPLLDRTELDVAQLRGRRLEGVRFGAFSHQLHIWVDGKGSVRHPSSHQIG